MSDFRKLSTTLSYARLGLVSLTAAIAPITGAAQELCGADLFEGEPDADSLMAKTLEFLDLLEASGVVAFTGVEGKMSVTAAREALLDGVASATLLTCVVNADSIEFNDGSENLVIACGGLGTPTVIAAPAPAADDVAEDAPAEEETLVDLVDETADEQVDQADDELAADTGDAGGEDTEAEPVTEVTAATEAGLPTGQLFCTTEIATIEQYLSSEA
ncbi:MAG: hypothetical protein CMH12_04860 [Maritimibacter sp.]|nr:hypothetical protein [Maritimibacter sp.]